MGTRRPGYRKDDPGPDGVYVAENFSFGGDEALRSVQLSDYPSLAPFGAYSLSSIAEPIGFPFGGLVTGLLSVSTTRRRRLRKPAA
ncbi:MAG: hypothetical protein KDA37_16910 [Planctomycetales bacterium]|nr:hypothetical protein [Planctomycetales bacterium]